MFNNLFGKKKEPTLEEIIAEIDKGLTDDREKNLRHLHACGDKYKHHPQNLEILRHVGRLIARNLPDEDKKALDALLDQDLRKMQTLLQDTNKLLKEGDIAGATKLLTDEQLDEGFDEVLFGEDEVTVYLDFSGTIEEGFYKVRFKPKKEIKQAPMPFKESYQLAAYIAFENKDYGKVLRITEKGLKRCPLAFDLMFERCEVFKIREQMDELWAAMKEYAPCFYKRPDIAHYFRNLGWYFTHQKEWDAAISCLAVSLYWHEAEIAENELSYIVQCGERSHEEVKALLTDYARCKSILEQKGLAPLPIDPNWVPLLLFLGEQGEKCGNFVFAAECYHWLHELTEDEDAKRRLMACVARSQG